MKKRIIIAGVSITLGLIIVLCVALLFAKYKMNLGEQSEITSRNFYFSSNFLKSDEEPPVYEIYGNTVTFEVRNFIDSLRINPTDIEFTVSAEGVTFKNDKTSGTLNGGTANSDSITLTYDFSVNNEDRKEITVTTTGTGYFTQTLKAKFVLIKPGSLMYEIKDRKNRDYAELYIYTGNTARNAITINWNKDKILIDETNDYVFGKLNSSKNSATTGNIAAYTTVKIVFLKNDIKANYTCGITKSDGTITIS